MPLTRSRRRPAGKTVAADRPQLALLQRPTVANIIIPARATKSSYGRTWARSVWNLTKEQVAVLDAASAVPTFAVYPYWHQAGSYPQKSASDLAPGGDKTAGFDAQLISALTTPSEMR